MFSIVEIDDGTTDGSMDVFSMRVIGPECSFCAALMAASVEGASADASLAGSAIMRVDAHRIEIEVDNRRPLLAIVESIV